MLIYTKKKKILKTGEENENQAEGKLARTITLNTFIYLFHTGWSHSGDIFDYIGARRNWVIKSPE